MRVRRFFAMIAIGLFLFSILGGVFISLSAVFRIRDIGPEFHLFGQSEETLARLTREGALACIDRFGDDECAHADIIRPLGDGRYEITSYVPASLTAGAREGDKRIVVSRTRTVLKDGRFCDEDGEIALAVYVSAAGEIRRDARLQPVSGSSASEFAETIGFKANGWDCMEYAEPPSWLDQGVLVRRGFAGGVLAGEARRVHLARPGEPLKLGMR